jgi:hypothetical protein
LNAIHDLPLFMAAALLLNLTPGPDMLYVLGTSSARGARAGVAAALGIGAGAARHTASRMRFTCRRLSVRPGSPPCQGRRRCGAAAHRSS